MKRLFCLSHYNHFTVSAIIEKHLLVGLKFYMRHIYCLLATNISATLIFYVNVKSCCAPVTLRVCLVRVRSFYIKSVKFSRESQSRRLMLSDSKMDIFPWLSNIYRWRIYLWNISYAFRKTAHLKHIKQCDSLSVAHASFLSEHLMGRA